MRIAAPPPLPPLREELTLHPGPLSREGLPTWAIHDPADNRFYRVGWAELEMLTRWSLGHPRAIARAVNRETTLSVTPEHVVALGQFLANRDLLWQAGPASTARFQRKAALRRGKPLNRLLHSYLFFRIPLLTPNRLLDRLLPHLGWIYRPGFWWGVLLATLLGLFLAGRQWERFLATIPTLSDPVTVAAGLMALLLVKVAHELGHALTARRLGCHVPTMGVAFMVLWPVFYTDTGEVWKLPRHTQRLQVGAAGMAAELTLAALATLAWSFLPPGPLQGAAFMVAGVAWIMSLAINLNPFMRFDGYYLLADWLEEENLQERGFAMGRWFLRELLFGLDAPPPEPLPAPRRRVLIWYAFGTWLYRFFLFLGIALLVYHFFIKVVGIFLMAVEVGWFVLRPIGAEFMTWFTMRQQLAFNRHVAASGLLLLLLGGLLWLPWQGSITAPALLQWQRQTTLYAPTPGRVEAVMVTMGEMVEEGQTLIRLTAPDTVAHGLAKEAQAIRRLQWRLRHPELDDDERGVLVVRQELEAAMLRRGGLVEEWEKLVIHAPHAGRVAGLPPHLIPGLWVKADEPLLLLVDPAGRQVRALVAETDLADLPRALGTEARFLPESPEWPAVTCRMGFADPVAAPDLGELPLLAAAHGGPIAARQDANGRLLPDVAHYPLTCTPHGEAEPLQHQLRGSLIIPTAPRPLWRHVWQPVAAVLIRESGF